MKIRKVSESDCEFWVSLAREAEPLFRGEMAENPDFHAFMKRKIESGEALICIEEGSDSPIGIIAFSRKNSRISWLAVTESARNKGAGSVLLTGALECLDRSKDITVTTFREGYLGGESARRLYQKFGFQDSEEVFHHGEPRSLMKRPPDRPAM